MISSPKVDSQAPILDAKILKFIKIYSLKKAPDQEFESLALAIFHYQFQRNFNYRKFCLLSKKTPKNVLQWKEIPAMPAVGFKELALTTFPIKEAVRVFKTSGTTGASATKARHQNAGGSVRDLWRTSADVPVNTTPTGTHFFDTLKLYEAVIPAPFKEFLLPDNASLEYFFLMSSPKDAPDSSLSYMMGVVNRCLAAGRGKFYIKKDKPQYENLLRDLRRSRSKVFLLATAFSLKAFLDFLGEKKINLKLPVGSRLMQTGGFKGHVKEVSKSKLYGECALRLGIPKEFCVSEYGMTELSSQFYDTTLRDHVLGLKKASFKKGPAWLKTLVIDPATGREVHKGGTGFLRHFDLANRGSVMAVQTEDLGRFRGQDFELLGRAVGSDLRGCSLNYEDFLKGVER